MDKRKSLINVSVSIAFRFVLLILGIVVRRFLIIYIGNEMNGLNSLYESIIGFLTVAELGIGSAITFCMYKPIIEGKKEKVAALYQFFQKTYLAIGGIILVVGIAIMPAIPYLARDYASLNVNLYVTFLLMLISVVLSYVFSSKISLINAYKDDYISTTITSCGLILQHVLQMLVLVFTRSMTWYLACRILAILVQWVITELVARRQHNDIISFSKQTLDAETKVHVAQNVKAMFMHRIGGVLVNSADSIIISAFIGVVALGKFSNYTMIMTAMTSTIMLVFTPLTSIVGHMFASDPEQTKQYFDFFFMLNFIIGVVFFLGYYAVIDNVITILFGSDLEVAKSISLVITINYFTQFMRQSTLLFRNATGTFYNDRWKPFFEGLSNVVLSIAFVLLFTKWFGEDFGIVGVIVATIITNLAICHLVEPFVLYKHAFGSSVKKHWLKNYVCIAIFTAALFALHYCMRSFESQWIELLVNGAISLAFSAVILLATMLLSKKFRSYCRALFARK